MEITDNRTEYPVVFGDLDVGDMFVEKGNSEFFLKTENVVFDDGENSEVIYNAVLVSDGGFYFFYWDTPVFPVTVKMTVMN